MKKGLLFIIVCTVGLMSSCVDANKIEISGANVRDLNVVSLTQASLGLEFQAKNRSGRDVRLMDVDILLSDNDGPVMGMKLKEEITLRRHSEEMVVAPIHISLKQGLGSYRRLQMIGQNNLQGGMISGVIVVRSGMTRKKLVIGPMGIREFASTYGIDIMDMISNVKN